MKKGIFIVIIIGMLGWALFEFWQTEEESAGQGDAELGPEEFGITEGKIAPNFELETLDGETVQLSDFRGEPVVINFWATWCPPCRAEIPDLQKVHDAEEAVVLAVNMTKSEQNEATVAAFKEEMQMTFPVVLDREAEVLDLYNVFAYPTSYIVDREGRISFAAMGAINEEQLLIQLQQTN